MLTAIPGFQVGHATNEEACTGCTVVLCPDETVGGVDIGGSASGTREMDASAIRDYFAPLQKWLDEQNRGKPVGW